MNWQDDWDEVHGWGKKKLDTGSPGKPWGGKPKKAWKRCWEENHKPLKILKGEILGAACGHPQKGYDIYIGLDHGMKFQNKSWPWTKAASDNVVEFLYPISDMCAPKSPKDFKDMIKWMAGALENGKKIHIGCIGGHGRTGLVLAALVAYTGVAPKKAIQWVRKHHCKKAVESASQITFLQKHYKVAKAEPTKGSGYGGTSKKYGGVNTPSSLWGSSAGRNSNMPAVKSEGSIW